MIVFALALAATAAAKGASPAPPATLQAQFDAATAAALDRRCGEALSLYAEIERNPAIMRNPLATASIAVRKGGCLVRTGSGVEGARAIHAGLPLLESRGDEFHDDIRDARMALALAARLRFDYETAIAEAEKALALSTGLFRAVPLLDLADMTMFDHDGRALKYAEEARAIVVASSAASKKDAGEARKQIAAVQTTVARVLLNEGRTKEAYLLLKDSLAKQGGLDLRIGIADVATRSDLAIAALLIGEKDRAREYLAYTGAGRIADAPFAHARAMDPPTCDPSVGLKPSDVAVVEFSLSVTGQVLSARPIYVTGTRGAALAFGRAVANWSWGAEEAAKVPLFYRALTRVELRCSTGADVPGTFAFLDEAAEAWLFEGQPAAPWEDVSAAAAVPLQRSALAAAAPGSRPELAALSALAQNVSLSLAERRSLILRATTDAAALHAPAPVRVSLASAALGLGDLSLPKWLAAFRALLADPTVAGDPLSAATLQLAIAAPYKSSATQTMRSRCWTR